MYICRTPPGHTTRCYDGMCVEFYGIRDVLFELDTYFSSFNGIRVQMDTYVQLLSSSRAAIYAICSDKMICSNDFIKFSSFMALFVNSGGYPKMLYVRKFLTCQKWVEKK